jgi:molecular chaperone GrpE (heat shock protein)
LGEAQEMSGDWERFAVETLFDLVSIGLVLGLSSRGRRSSRQSVPISESLAMQKSLDQNPLEQKSLEQKSLEQTIAELQRQCLFLQAELRQQQEHLKTDCRNTTFEQLQPLLTSLPTIRKMIEIKPDLPARNLIALFTHLDNWLQDWGIEAIGTPWEQVPYDPQLHQPDTEDYTPGEPVYIRFVGYRTPSQILYPAQVSRTPPPFKSAD